MKGNETIIKHLNALLAGELTAIDQYFIHSRMYEDWGYTKLFERIKHEHEEETEHATRLIQRILFLEGTPDLTKRIPEIKVGKTVPKMLKNDLKLEYLVVDHLRDVIAFCEKEGDFETREILEVLLDDTEEDHTYWLEQQLGLIEHIGLNNYLQSQM
jgi:bacterioferritin